LTLGNKSTVDI